MGAALGRADGVHEGDLLVLFELVPEDGDAPELVRLVIGDVLVSPVLCGFFGLPGGGSGGGSGGCRLFVLVWLEPA